MENLACVAGARRGGGIVEIRRTPERKDNAKEREGATPCSPPPPPPPHSTPRSLFARFPLLEHFKYNLRYFRLILPLLFFRFILNYYTLIYFIIFSLLNANSPVTTLRPQELVNFFKRKLCLSVIPLLFGHKNWNGHIFISFVFPQFTTFHSVFHSFHGLMNSINWPASSVWVFIAQLGEHCSANAEATGSNPVEAPKNFFSAFLAIA